MVPCMLEICLVFGETNVFGITNAFVSLSKAHMLTVSDDEARLNFSDFFFIKVLTGRIIVLQTEAFDCRGAVCTSAG